MKHSINQLLSATLECCNVTRDEWDKKKNSRVGTIVRVRQIVIFIAKELGYTQGEIAEFFGRDRTSIIYHLKTLGYQMDIYPGIKDLVSMVRNRIAGVPPYQTQMIASGWIARSSSGLLTISHSLPIRFSGYWIAEGSKPLPRDEFPQITYETGPVKVKIKVTLEENEKM